MKFSLKFEKNLWIVLIVLNTVSSIMNITRVNIASFIAGVFSMCCAIWCYWVYTNLSED